MASQSLEPEVFRWTLDPSAQVLRVEDPRPRPGHRQRQVLVDMNRLDPAVRDRLMAIADGSPGAFSLSVVHRRRRLTVVGTGPGCGLFIDTSRQQRAFEDVSRRVRLLEEGIDALPEAFVLYDNADRLLIANPRYAQLYPTIADLVRPGVTFHEIATAAVERDQFRFEESKADWLARRLEFHRKGEGFFEQRLGDGRAIQLSERPTRSGGIASIRADITLLRQREAALEDAKLSAEQTSRSMARFLAVFSHEVRNGLNGLVGAAQILALDAKTRGQQEEAELLFESSRRLTRVLTDLLDYLKNEATGVGIHAQAMDPARVLETAFAEFEALAIERGLQLRLKMQPGLPSHVLGDAGRIQQVMANLTSNAIKYSRKGAITLALDIVGERLRYAVSDEGIGIDEKDLEGLFEFFSRASPDNPHSTGLGLAISRQIVLAMGGDIGVESRRDQGSRFWFDLPLNALDIPTPPIEEPLPVLPDRSFVVGVLDDDPLSRSIAEHFLQRLGHRAMVCENGDEVLKLARQGMLDALLLDLMMPGESGTEIATRIRADAAPPCARLAIVVVTGNVLPDSLTACQTAGADAVVQKPLFIGSLDQVLRMSVGTRQAGHAAASPVQVDEEPAEATLPADDAPDTLRRLQQDIGANNLAIGLRAALALFDSLQRELAEARSERLASLLHRAQGTAPQLGLRAIGEVARRLQDLEEQNTGEEAAAARRQLASLLPPAAALLQQHLAELDASPAR